MIANIEPAFSSPNLNRKIDYQIEKINKNVAREIFNSTGSTLSDFSSYMHLVAGMNERVKLPYTEFILNLKPGEELADDRFVEMAQDYLGKMGYGDCCYSIIHNSDKVHSHVHILVSTIDMDGNHISDANDFSRSNDIARELEKKYGLSELPAKEKGNSKRLNELNFRKYYFDTALHKGYRSYNTKPGLEKLLSESDFFLSVRDNFSTHSFSNDEWKNILGESLYEEICGLLDKGKYFNTLYKDELLTAMDKSYMKSNTATEFREMLEREGYYMRLVSKNNKSYYIYGIPDDSFYLKDTSLPQKYRFGSLRFDITKMNPDEQKHILYDEVFSAMKDVSSYDEFKKDLSRRGVHVIEHLNKNGISDISFVIKDAESPFVFKSSDISRRLTYNQVQSYFSGQENILEPVVMGISRKGEIRSYSHPTTDQSKSTAIPSIDIAGGEKSSKVDEKNKKRKKRKGRGFSI